MAHALAEITDAALREDIDAPEHIVWGLFLHHSLRREFRRRLDAAGRRLSGWRLPFPPRPGA